MSDLEKRIADLSPEKRALLAKRLGRAPGGAQPVPPEAIAVLGIGCRFPGGASSPQRFWENLIEGVDCISLVPPDRWDNDAFCDPNHAAPNELGMRWGGFVHGVDEFDAAFFHISPKEAARMDPQQRLFLETAWEALENAGLPPQALAGSPTGVFVGAQSQIADYYFLQLAGAEDMNAYTATGTAHSIIANRLSYFLDLRGPSLTVDTACSSSLVALHLACESLRHKECGTAIAGGVSVILSPEISVSYTHLQFLSPDGRCKAFDAGANGFVRGEGCGVLVLRRLSDALRGGDPILAVIRGSAVNQDGASNGLTAPNGLAQQAVVRQALRNAGLDPSRVTFVETHGTGTILGDPIEVEALNAVVGRAAEKALPCYLGALKSNIGHLEAAAGIAGVIKAVLCLHHRHVPRNLHFTRLNPHICLEGSRLAIPTQNLPWETSGVPRCAGVSSFGFGGTNAHVILEEAPAAPNRRAPLPPRPWQRQRYWLDTAPSTASAGRPVPQKGISTKPVHPLLGLRMDSPLVLFESLVSPGLLPRLGRHRIAGTPVFPMSSFLEIPLAAAAYVLSSPVNALILERAAIEEPLVFPGRQTRTLQTFLDSAGEGLYSCRVFSRPGGALPPEGGTPNYGAEQESAAWTLHMRAKVRQVLPGSEPFEKEEIPRTIDEIRGRCAEETPGGALYDWYSGRGFEFGAEDQGIASVQRGNHEAIALLRLSDTMLREAADYALPPAMLDACLQVFGALWPGYPESEAYLPTGLDSLLVRCGAAPHPDYWIHARLREGGGPEVLTGDLWVFEGTGIESSPVPLHLVARVRGLVFRRANVETFRHFAQAEVSTPLDFKRRFRETPEAERPPLVDALARSQIAAILGLGADSSAAGALDADTPLPRLGFDSLMAVELRNRLRAETGVEISLREILESASLRTITAILAERLKAASAHSPLPLAPSSHGDPHPPIQIPDDLDPAKARYLLDHLDQLSDLQVEALLEKMALWDKGARKEQGNDV